MSADMQRVNLILSHSEYKKCLYKLNQLEQDRKFCKHTLEHFLDTARIMYITSLEQSLALDKEIIYATALLHDMGRVAQYESNIPHEKASADFAKKILADCNFTEDEISEIKSAILSHRENNKEKISTLGRLLYYADKRSRLCFNCSAEKECYWSADKKNMDIIL